MKPILILVSTVFVAACASVKTFNMPKVEDNLSRAFQSSDDINAQMQSDYSQKKTLMESLRKTKSATFKDIEPQLTAKMSIMETHMNAALKQRKAMSEAKGQITSLGYAKKKIAGDEPEYARVEEAVKDFEEGAAGFTKASGEYSRESNSLAEVVAVKKLYFNFDVMEFQKKVQQSIGSAQENSKIMAREIQRSEDIRLSFEDENKRMPVEQVLAQMNMINKEHSQKIQTMNELNTQMKTIARGQTKIPSTVPNWSEVQRIVSDSDRTSLAMNELFKDFQIKVDRVRNLPKSNP